LLSRSYNTGVRPERFKLAGEASGLANRFELRHTQGLEVSSDRLLEDLRRVAATGGNSTVTYRDYAARGKFAPHTLMRRFGSWNKALVPCYT